MNKRKLVITILSIVFVLSMSLFAISCDKTTEVVKDDFGPEHTVSAQVGYEFTIPSPNNLDEYDSVTIKDADGNELEIVDGKVFFDTVGEYFVTYTAGEETYIGKVLVIDTEKPRFDAFWDGLWHDNRYFEDPEQVGGYIRLFREIGETVNLSEIFKAKDNSGDCNVSFKVFRGGVDEIELESGTTFVMENCDYMIIKATAVDGTGNNSTVTYRMYPEYDAGRFMDFDFNEGPVSRYAVVGADTSAESYELRRNMALSTFGYTLRSMKFPIKSNYGVVNTLFENTDINFSTVYAVSFRIYIDSGDTVYTLTGADMPNVSNGTTVTESVKTNEWQEMVVTNNGMTGVTLGVNIPDLSTKFGGDYDVYVDDIYVQFYPDIKCEESYIVVKTGELTSFSDLGIEVSDKNGGEVTATIEIESIADGSKVTVSNNQFMLTNKGVYTLTVKAIKNGTIEIEKSFTMVGTNDPNTFDPADIVKDPANFGADYLVFNDESTSKWLSIKLDTTVPKDTQVTVKYKIKTDVTGVWTTLFIPNHVTVSEPLNEDTGAIGIFSKGFGDYRDWTNVSYTNVYVTDGQTAYNRINAWSTDASGTVIANSTAVGVYVLIPNVNPGQMVAIKDVVIEAVGGGNQGGGSALPDGAEYAVTQVTGEYYSAIMIPSTGFNEGDVVTVSYKFKTTMTTSYSGIFGVGTDGNITLDANVWPNMNNFTDWTSGSMTVKVTSGPTAMQVFDTWSTDAVANLGITGLSNDVGIWLIFCNHQNGYVAIKDVEVSGQSTGGGSQGGGSENNSDGAEYLVNQVSGEYYSAIKIPSTGFNEGDVVTVTYKLKTSNDYGYSGVFWVGANGSIDLDANIWPNMKNISDWVECTATIKITTGPTAMQVFDAWAGDPVADMGITGLANDVGIWLVFCNHTSGFVAIKDVSVTLAN